MGTTIQHIETAATLTLGGTAYAVLSFALSLEHNDIPTLTARISTTGRAVDVVDFAELMETYRSLSALSTAEEAAREAQFNCVIKPNTGVDQVLALTSWVLTAVGLSASRRGGVAVEARISHPAHMATEGNLHFTRGDKDFNAHTAIQAALEADNPLEAVLAAIQAMVTDADASDADAVALHQRTQAAMVQIQEHVVWRDQGATWPDLSPGLTEEAIKRASADYAMNAEAADPWSFVSRALCTDWGLSISPDYWRELSIVPYRPWAEPSLEIGMDDILELSQPASDLDMLAGLRTGLRKALGGYYGLMWPPEGLESATQGWASWLEDVPGPINQFNLPPWFNAAVAYTIRGDDYRTSSFGPRPSIASAETGAAEIPEENVPDIQDAAKTYCKYMFTTQFSRNRQIALKMRLSLDYNGERIVPGSVYSIRFAAAHDEFLPPNESGGAPTFEVIPDTVFDEPTGTVRFFATRVRHEVNCQAGKAYTWVSGSYASYAPGPNLESIRLGKAPNYLYD